MNAQHSHSNYPKLHNAMWPGLVGKGSPGAEPCLDLDTMLELTAGTTDLDTTPAEAAAVPPTVFCNRIALSSFRVPQSPRRVCRTSGIIQSACHSPVNGVLGRNTR